MSFDQRDKHLYESNPSAVGSTMEKRCLPPLEEPFRTLKLLLKMLLRFGSGSE